MNIFSGLISTELKSLHSNMISAMLYDDACTIPCTLHFTATKYDDCINCVFDPIGQKSANRYQSGGPLPFPFGSICPMCGGEGRKAVETTESIKLMVIFNYKDFINRGSVASYDEDMIQVVTFDENSVKLERAKELVVDSDKGGHARHRFSRVSKPMPCGFGGTDFVECLFKRSG